MESIRTASTYYIPPGKFLLIENPLGNPDLIQSSVAADCDVTIVDADNFPLDNLEQWPVFNLRVTDLRLNGGSGMYYVYVKVPETSNTNVSSASIAYSTYHIDRDGYIILEDGAQGEKKGEDGFKYYEAGTISARGGNQDASTNPPNQGRIITIDLGKTPPVVNLPGNLSDLEKVLYVNKVDPANINSWLLMSRVPFQNLEIVDSLKIGNGYLKWDDVNKGFYVEDSEGNLAGFYSSWLSAKGVNAGTGGGTGGEGGATSLGELNNVGAWADEIPSADRIMVQLSGATHWTSKPLSELVGLDEDKLAEYLAQNSYATQAWVTEKLGGYATTAALKTVSDKLDDFLTGTDTDNIINKWKELEAFLAGFHETDTLAGALSLKADKAITISAGTGLSGGGDLSANRTLSLKTATATALGGIKVGNRLSIDDNGVLSATYTYTLPTASDTVLGGIKVGGTLDIASDILNLKATGTAGTYFKVTTDAYGRVTSGSNPTTLSGFGITDAKIANGVITLGTNTITPLTSASSLAWGKITGKPTTLAGYGITDGVNSAPVTGTGNAVTSVSLSGHTLTFTKGSTFLTKAAFDDLFEKVNIGTASAPVYAIRAKYGLYSEEFLSVKGIAPGTGGSGGGSEYLHDLLDVNLSSPANGQVLSYDSASQKWVNKTIQQGLDTSAMWAALAGVDATKKIDASHLPALTKSQVEAVLTGNITSHTHSQYYDSTLSRTANTVLAAPNGSAGVATFRKLVAADMPSNVAYYNFDESPSYQDYAWFVIGLFSITDTYKGGAGTSQGTIYINRNSGAMWSANIDYSICNLYSDTDLSASNQKCRMSASGNTTFVTLRPCTFIYNGIKYAGFCYQAAQSLTKIRVQAAYAQCAPFFVRYYNSNSGSAINSEIYNSIRIEDSDILFSTNRVYGNISSDYNITAAKFIGNLEGNAETATKLGTATVGGTAKGMYLNAGVPTAMSATAGSASRPVYLNGGTVTQCSYAFGNASGNAALNNGTLNTNLNADMLDGVHLNTILERGNSKSKSISAVGWYRIAKSKVSDVSGLNLILFLCRNYYSPANESYAFSISISYNGAISITQLSGKRAASPLITKIRVDYKASSNSYIDFYIGSNTGANTYYWTIIGNAESLAGDSVSALTGTAYEFTTVNGCKSDLGFTGNLTGNITGNASTATKLLKAITIALTGSVTGSVSFDGSSNVSISTVTNHTHTFASLTSKPTTLAGYGITDGVNSAPVTGTGNAVTSVSLSGHTLTFTKGETFLTKSAFDDLFEKVNIGTASAPVYAIRAKYGLYSDEFLSVKGIAPGTGGSGGGSEYLHDLLDVNLSSPANGQVLSYDSASQKWVNKSIQQGLDTSAMWAELAKADATKKIDASHIPTSSLDSRYVTVATGQTVTGDKVFSKAVRIGASDSSRYSKLNPGSIQIITSGTSGYAGGMSFKTTEDGSTKAVIGAYLNQTDLVYYYLGVDYASPIVKVSPSGGITASSFIKAGGTSSQFLKADGSVDSNAYATKEFASSAYVSALGTSGNYLTWTKGGVANNITVPYATNAGTASKLGTSTVGGTAKGMYLNAGVPTAMSATVGSASRPVYLNGGTVTQCSYAFGNASGNAALNNGTVNTNLNADMLDGVHLNTILERGNSKSKSISAVGWYRIAKTKLTDVYGTSFILYVSRTYNNTNNEAYSFSISISYAGGISITQLSGKANTRLISKIRVDHKSSEVEYIDLYVGTSSSGNIYYWTTIGNAESLAGDSVSTLTGTAYEFTTVNGCKSDLGFTGSFTGDIAGNASTATKLQTARTLWGQSFSGTANVSGDMTGVGNVTFAAGDNGRNLIITKSGAYKVCAGTGSWAAGFSAYKNDKTTALGSACGVYGTGDTLSYLYYGGNYSSPAMVILPNKYVGIGTTSPTEKLHVAGNINGVTYYLRHSTTNPYLRLTLNGANWYAQAASSYMYLGSASAKSLRIDASGNVYTPGTFNAKVGIWSDGYVSAAGENTSDLRLKTDIGSFNATSIIKSLRPVSFRWNNLARQKNKVFDTDEVQYGLIAQEVKSATPWAAVDDMFGDGYMGVRYSKFIPVLMKAQIETIDEVGRLKQRLSALERENERLRKEIQTLKAA